MIPVVIVYIQKSMGEYAVGKGLLILTVLTKQVLDSEEFSKFDIQSSVYPDI